MFRNAVDKARELHAAQDAEFVEVKARGKAATISGKHGGVSFFKPKHVDVARPPSCKKRRLNDGVSGVCFGAPWLSNSMAVVGGNEQEHAANLLAISKWASAQPRDSVQPEHIEAGPIPVGGGTADMSVKVRELLPPSKPLVQAVLDASDCERGRKDALIAHWAQAHCTLEHRSARAVIVPRKAGDVNKPVCCMSRSCMCQHGKASAPALLIKLLKSWFGKGCVGRATYSEQGAVVALTRAGVVDDSARWLFIGHGHLGKSWFTVQQLVRAPMHLFAGMPLPHGSIVLQSGQLKPQTMYNLHWDVADVYHAQLFRLDYKSLAQMRSFRPAAIVQAVTLEAVMFFDPNGGKKHQEEKASSCQAAHDSAYGCPGGSHAFG